MHEYKRWSFAYLSPEQCLGEPLDGRTDLFSVGILLYEMITGQSPFQRGTDLDTILAVRSDALAHPVMRRPDVPPALATIVEQALEKSPDQRWSSADELAAALETFGAQTGFTLNRARLGAWMRACFPHELSEQSARLQGYAELSRRRVS